MGERREALSIPPPVDLTGITPPPFYIAHQDPPPEPVPSDMVVHVEVVEDATTVPTEEVEAEDSNVEPFDTTKPDEESQSTEQDQKLAAVAQEEDSNVAESKDGEIDNDQDDDGQADDDSDEAVGKDEAVEKDRDMMDDEEGDDDGKDGDAEDLVVVDTEVGKVKTMLQKILSLGTAAGQSAGQMAVKVLDVADVPSTGETGASKAAPPPHPEPESTGPNSRKPTLVHNGRMVRHWHCSLSFRRPI